MQISVNKEKAVVALGGIGTAVAGYIAGAGYPAEGALVGVVFAGLLAFWSQCVNTED